VFHEEGNGVLQDYKQAVYCYKKAAEQGYENARNNRDVVAKQMTPAQIEKVQELSKVYYDKHVKQ
jgi:TPR repeat protein